MPAICEVLDILDPEGLKDRVRLDGLEALRQRAVRPLGTILEPVACSALCQLHAVLSESGVST